MGIWITASILVKMKILLIDWGTGFGGGGWSAATLTNELTGDNVAVDEPDFEWQGHKRLRQNGLH